MSNSLSDKMKTQTGNTGIALEDEQSGDAEFQKGSGGAGLTAPVGVTGTVQTQTELGVGATVVSMTFDPPIKACNINVNYGEGTAAANEDEAALFAFDPPNSVVAADWLNEANIAPRNKIKPKDGVRGFYFGGGLVTTIYMKAKGTTPDLDIDIEGIS